MIYIAHRGLFKGPNKKLENNPDQIQLAISQGFECEVDLRVVDDKLYLGHDEPQYEVSEDWLKKSRLWIHSKNKEAMSWLYYNQSYKFNYFWHEDDQHTLTSRGFIWTHPKSELLKFSVMVMPEYVDKTLDNAVQADCFAICSDYVEKIREKRK